MTKMELYHKLQEITHHTSCMDMDAIVEWIYEHMEEKQGEKNGNSKLD